MAISSRIPMVGTGGDIFKDVMDYFEQVQSRKAQQQFQQQQLAQQGQYQKGELGIRQQEANIAARQFADEHAKALLETDPKAFAKMFAGLGNMGTAGASSPGAPGISPGVQTPASPVGVGASSAPNAPNQSSMTPLQRMWMKKYMGLEETPDEKQQRAIETAGSSETAKLKAKKEQDYLDAGDVVNQYAPNMKTISDLLDKNEIFLTGNIAGVRNMAHIGSEDQGKFNGAALPLLGQLTKDISQRGGAVVAKLATAGKPNLWNSPATNRGLTDQLIQKSIDSFNQAKQNYEESTGKAYPKKLDPFLKDNEKVNVRKPNGEIISLPRKGAKKLVKKYPDHQIME